MAPTGIEPGALQTKPAHISTGERKADCTVAFISCSAYKINIISHEFESFLEFLKK